MSDEKWLRDGLASAVPDPPSRPDRARAAESRARRRRRTTSLAVLGSCGAVAAAAVLTAALSSGSGNAPGPAGTAPDRGPVVECPPIEVDDGVAKGSAIDEPDPDAPGAVPDGATSARLCQGPGTTIEVPSEALVTDVGALVGTVNDLPVTEEHEMCPADLGPGFRIAFGYPDGSSFVVSGELYGCRTMVVGNGYRVDPQAPLDTFVDLLRAQRGGRLPGAAIADPEDLDCRTGPHPTQALADPTEMLVAKLCVGDAELVIPEEDLPVLVEDLRTHQGSTTTGACRAIPTTIVGVTRWGDRFSLYSECGTTSYELPGGAGHWNPSQEVQRLLESYADAD